MKYVISEIIPEVTEVPEAIEKFYPLWQYCPKYTAVLEPGDMLLSPSWYWHDVANITDITMGVATRWLPMNKTANRFFTLLQLAPKSSWETIFSDLFGSESESNKSKSKVTDEKIKAVQDLDDMIAFGKPGEAKRIWEEKKQKAKTILSDGAYQQYCLKQDSRYVQRI